MILREARDRGERQAFARSVVPDPAFLDQAGATEPVPDPQSAGAWRIQFHDVVRMQALPADRIDAFEAHAIEAKQARGAGNPKITIGGLRQRLDARRRAVGCSPGRVIELPESEIRR